MAPTYKLTYFNITALGEPIRFLLSYGKVEFEDNRVERENWPQIKGSTPFGQMPVLEVDGKKVWQSMAICRYLGKEFGLSGSNEWENLQIDVAAETVNDLRLRIAQYFYEADPAEKEKKKGPLFNEFLPSFLPKLENLAKDNGGHLAVGKLTWADVYFASLAGYFDAMTGTDTLKDCPTLVALKQKVYDIPAIKEYLAKRPKTDM